jgi:hypothetical protein
MPGWLKDSLPESDRDESYAHIFIRGGLADENRSQEDRENRESLDLVKA